MSSVGLSLLTLVMASAENVPGSATESPMSDHLPETIHETMTRVIHFERWRVERYMLKHNLRPIPVYDRELDWSREIDTSTPSLDPPPRVAESFLDPLTEDIVLSKVWPLLMEGLSMEVILASSWPMQMEGYSWVSKFQISCNLRCVCKSWKQFVEDRPEWPKSLEWWCDGLHRLPIGQFDNPLSTTDGSSDSEESETYEESDSDTE